MGLRASNTVELLFNDCKVPKENLIGREGIGFKIAMTALDSGRIGIASQALGITRACLDESIRYAKERKQFGKTISSFEAIQWMIADMATGLEAANLLTLSAAWRKDQGMPFTRKKPPWPSFSLRNWQTRALISHCRSMAGTAISRTSR